MSESWKSIFRGKNTCTYKNGDRGDRRRDGEVRDYTWCEIHVCVIYARVIRFLGQYRIHQKVGRTSDGGIKKHPKNIRPVCGFVFPPLKKKNYTFPVFCFWFFFADFSRAVYVRLCLGVFFFLFCFFLVLVLFTPQTVRVSDVGKPTKISQSPYEKIFEKKKNSLLFWRYPLLCTIIT